MSKRDGFSPVVAVVVVAVLLVIGGRAYYLFVARQPAANSTSDVPADWQTYRNEEYGFEFQYPVDWIFEDSEVSGYIGTLIQKKDLNRETEIPLISMKIYDNKDKLEMQKWWSVVRKTEDEGGEPEGIYQRLVPVSMAVALQITTTESWEGIPYESLYIPLDNKVLEITSIFGALSLDQILSTFKFVEP